MGAFGFDGARTMHGHGVVGNESGLAQLEE
jgi:hypothetical protein